MKRHISILGEEIWHYFLDLEDFQKYCRFVNNPFRMSVGHQPSQDNLLQEQFIDLVNEGNVRRLFGEKPCSDICIKMAQTYPDISKMALKVLIPFPTTYEVNLHFWLDLLEQLECFRFTKMQMQMPSSQKLETSWMRFMI